jgi:hypothetical protein
MNLFFPFFLFHGVSLPACSSLLYTCVPLPPFPHGISTDFSFTEMGMFVSISRSQAAAQPPSLKTWLRGCRLSHIQQAKICVQGTSRGDCLRRRHAIFIVRRSGTRGFAYTCACSGGGGGLPRRERRRPQIYWWSKIAHCSSSAKYTCIIAHQTRTHILDTQIPSGMHSYM